MIAALFTVMVVNSCDRGELGISRIRVLAPISPRTVSGIAGLPLAQPLRVFVADSGCNYVALEGTGVANQCSESYDPGPLDVTWTVSPGGGSLSATSTPLDALREASVVWTLSPTAGTATVTATVTPLPGAWASSTTFTATVVAQMPVVAISSGNLQGGLPGGVLALPAQVQVTTNTLSSVRVPLANVEVFWTAAGGTVSPPSSRTDAQGFASTNWQLGPAVGPQTMIASTLALPGADPLSVFSVQFQANAQVGQSRSLRVISGNQQRGIIGRTLLQPLVVEYVTLDPSTGAATPIPNAPVTFVPGAGSANPVSGVTSSQGRLSTAWTLGAALGAQSLTISTPPVGGTDPSSVFQASASATAESADLLLQDDFSSGLQWIVQELQNDRNAWASSVQSLGSGGNPGGFRRMTHDLTTTTNPDFVTLFVRHLYSASTYTPSAQGAIAAIDYGEDRQSPIAVYGSFVVVQGGVTYQALFANSSTFSGGWQRSSLTGIRPSDFSPAPGPDFSTNGGPMQFGFVRGNSGRFSGAIVHDIDNWSVLIRR